MMNTLKRHNIKALADQLANAQGERDEQTKEYEEAQR